MGNWTVEWGLLWGRNNLFLGFGRGRFSLGLGLLFIYLSSECKGRKRFHLACHDKAIWLNFWHDPMDGYSRSEPWHKRTWSFHPLDVLLGRMKHHLEENVQPAVEVLIPMPEGCYKATISFERRTWWRPRWPFSKIVREACDIRIPGGIPFQGKGENGWDCGDDGLWGIGSDSYSVPKAIVTVVQSVLESRKRYGNTSSARRRMESVVPLNATS